jgi:SAM-dependent methyltransferase
MIGRQFCVMGADELHSMFEEFGLDPEGSVLNAAKGYAEPILEFLGAEEIVSLDANSYQDASLVHDMNLPIPGELKNRFDVVVEGGSLEHIFNFPVAVKNCMEMLVPGGSYLGVGPADNFCGHGFYQFSPDLYFRVLSPENGFILERMILCGVKADADWLEVLDPLATRQFVESLGSNNPTYVLVHAQKLQNRRIFEKFPEQSVYTLLWKGEHPGEDRAKFIIPSPRT